MRAAPTLLPPSDRRLRHRRFAEGLAAMGKGTLKEVSRAGSLRVLLVGVGPHSKQVYWPLLAERVAAVVELEVNREATEALVGPCVEVVTTPPFVGSRLPDPLRERLNEVVDLHRIGAVIVATEPLVHEAYMEWAIGRALPILVDKPIIAYANVSNNPAAARRLLTAYDRLQSLAAANPDVLVAVAVHRRHHPAFETVREIILEASTQFGCPITAIQSSHADGQFRHPLELLDETYHGFNSGYGKLFHSGFHLIDVQAWLTAGAAEAAGIRYDSVTSSTAAIRPPSFLRQVPRETYDQKWGSRWRAAWPASDTALAARMREYGELDLAVLTAISSDGLPLTLSQITLLHTSFSRRSWPASRTDLYKGNGRVKHEHHNILVGPFLSVQVHSYQAKDQHDRNDDGDYAIGGNSHLDINIFRNADWWGRKVEPLETLTMRDLAEACGLSSGDLVINQAKRSMVEEFLACVTGRLPVSAHRSRLADHRHGAVLLSTIAESIATGAPSTRHFRGGSATRKMG